MKVDGKRVTELRNRRSWSQDELAIAAGLNLRTIQRVENAGAASLQSVKAIASALQVDAEEFKYSAAGARRDSARCNRAFRGIRRRAALRIAGLPLYDIAFGPDPERNEILGHAKGIVAVGNSATGGLAVGGLAVGGIAVGGATFGLISFGGFSLGLLAAVGGLAIGTLAVGGAAGGFAAVGGGSVGYYACGGASFGKYATSATRRDASVDAFLDRHGMGMLCPGGPRTAAGRLQ